MAVDERRIAILGTGKIGEALVRGRTTIVLLDRASASLLPQFRDS